MNIDTHTVGRIATAVGVSTFTMVATASTALAQTADPSDDAGLYELGGSMLLLATKAAGVIAIGLAVIALSRRHEGKLTSRRAERQLSARLRARGNQSVVLPAAVYEQEYDRALAVKAPASIRGTYSRPAVAEPIGVGPVGAGPGMVGLLAHAPVRPAGPPHGMPTPPPQLHRPHQPVVQRQMPRNGPVHPVQPVHPLRPGQYPAWPVTSNMVAAQHPQYPQHPQHVQDVQHPPRRP